MQDENKAAPSAVTVAPAKPDATKSLSKQTAEMWSAYLTKDHVNDFSILPVYAKLALMQTLPKDCIDYRKVGGAEVPYIKHEIAEKALNFAFNFAVDTEIIKDGGEWSTVNGKKCYESVVLVKFTFHTKDGNITRTVYAGHRLFESAATTKADAFKSALSKAYTIVARSFGIGSNYKDGKTVTPIAKAESAAFEKAEAEPVKPVVKSFAPAGQGLGSVSY